jgi:hypothetical protein
VNFSDPIKGKLFVTIADITISGPDAGDFAQTNNRGWAPGKTVTLQSLEAIAVSVTFTPGAAGSRKATLSVKDTQNQLTATVQLTGSGA